MKESGVRKMLGDEWRLLVSVLTPILAVAAAYFAQATSIALIQQRLTVIESNHLTHIQAAQEKMSEEIGLLKVQQAETKVLLMDHIGKR